MRNRRSTPPFHDGATIFENEISPRLLSFHLLVPLLPREGEETRREEAEGQVAKREGEEATVSRR